MNHDPADFHGTDALVAAFRPILESIRKPGPGAFVLVGIVCVLVAVIIMGVEAAALGLMMMAAGR